MSRDPQARPVTFLSDQPLSADREQEMRFGHRSIVANLEKMILICPTPFTIGLFGKWGTGKTTILNALGRKLRAGGIAVVEIDAWKHEGDALRRTFLEDAVSQLQAEQEGREPYLRSDFQPRDNVKASISTTEQGPPIIKLSNRSQLAILVGLVVILALAGILIWHRWPQYLSWFVTLVLSAGLVGIVFNLLVRNVTVVRTTTTMSEAFKDPAQFDAELKRVCDEVKAKRLLFMIDNLDRVTREQAVTLLCTIKTFLEQERCVFLIACDPVAIKKHLERVYLSSPNESSNGSPAESEEFLRKFFNCYLAIPQFIDTELQSYTEDLLKETNHPTFQSAPDTAYVIQKAFRENPRQVKQFINALLAHFLLAQEREDSGDLPKGLVTENLAYLAKALVIREKFPEYAAGLLTGRQDPDSKGDEKIRDFLDATEIITSDLIAPFFYLKLSDEEVSLPGITEVRFALQDNKAEVVRMRLAELLENADTADRFDRWLRSSIRNQRARPTILYNTISSTLEALQYIGKSLSRHFYLELAQLLDTEPHLWENLVDFSSTIIFEQVLSQCSPSLRQRIVSKYTELLSHPEHIGGDAQRRKDVAKELLSHLVLHRDWIAAEVKPHIGMALAGPLCDHETLSVFRGDSAAQKELILGTETLPNFINSISAADLEPPGRLGEKIDLVCDFKEIMTGDDITKATQKLTELLEKDTSQPPSEKTDTLLSSCGQFIRTFSFEDQSLAKEVTLPFMGAIINGIRSRGSWQDKERYVPCCLALVDIAPDPTKGNINSELQGFFQTANSEGLTRVFDGLQTDDEKQALLARYDRLFQSRAVGDQGVFRALYRFAPANTRTRWLVEVVKADPQRAVQELEFLRYRVPDVKAIVSASLDKAKQVVVGQKEPLYRICTKLRCANDQRLRVEFASLLEQHLTDANASAQQLGLAALHDATWLIATLRREIAVAVIGWLHSLSPETAAQQSSIRSVVENWKALTKASKAQFLAFVLSKLIEHGPSPDNVALGFETLAHVDPKLEFDIEYEMYFEDILRHTNSESNAAIKNELVQGLTNLRTVLPQDLRRSLKQLES